jgi:lipid-A-disaccharide synthase
MARRVFMTAAEASGDQHAAELARSLRQLDPSIQIDGIGGAKMAAAGVTIHHESIGRAAMGWRGALRAVEVWRWMRWLKRRYRDDPPDLHISVDSSAMNLPFAKLAKRLSVPVMYYIAPQLWASREGRIKQVRVFVDRLAVIFPFEQEYFRKHGVSATFVGHPLFDALPRQRPRSPAPKFPEAPPVIGVIPGSRRSEVKANLPHLLDVTRRLRAAHPGARFLIPTTSITHELVKRIAGAAPVGIDRDGFDRIVPQCDLCLVKSGTSTVQVAAYGVPMIVVYRLNPLLWHLAARWIIKTPHIAMVNILAGNIELVPEFIPWYGSNNGVAACALDFLAHPKKLAEQSEKLRELIATIDHPGASLNAAKLALEMIEK